MFEHLKQLWVGIWQHIHTVTTTEVSPDLGELSEIMYDVNVEMIHYAITEAVEPFKLHPTSMSYLCLHEHCTRAVVLKATGHERNLSFWS